MANGEYGLSTESRVARLEQRVIDLNDRITALSVAMTPMVETVARQSERTEILRRDLANYAANVGKLDDELERRERDVSRERQSNRRWMIGLTVTIFCALLTAATVLATAGVH